MPFEQQEDTVTILTPDGFDIEEALDSGQSFRYGKLGEGTFYLIAHGRILYITQKGTNTYLHPCTQQEYNSIWRDYFDLSRDYTDIKQQLSQEDAYMSEAISLAPGIRIMKQEKWECLISFIISANNRIPMIKQVVHNLSQRFGEPIAGSEGFAQHLGLGGAVHAFPTPKALASAREEDILACKAGFRSKYISAAARLVHSGALDLDNAALLPSTELRKALIQVNGVGVKVADCVMLLSYARGDVFPIDVWIRRIMQEQYFGRQEMPLPKIQELATQKWGGLAGYANQYLFNFARANKIGTQK